MNLKKIVTVGGIVVACALPIMCAEMIGKELPDTIDKWREELEYARGFYPIREKEHVEKEVANDTSKVLSDVEKNQLKIMEDKICKWVLKKKNSYLGYCYTVTDLDQNGRMELIVSSGTSGSGQFTDTSIYQINEDRTKLEKCDDYNQEGVSQADVVNNINQVYYNKNTDTYHYLTTDYAADGGAGWYSFYGIEELIFQKNKLSRETLTWREHDIYAKKKQNVDKYYMDQGKKIKEISESEYMSGKILLKKYKDFERMKVDMYWFGISIDSWDIADSDIIRKPTRKKIRKMLQKSYQAFAVKDIDRVSEKENALDKEPVLEVLEDQFAYAIFYENWMYDYSTRDGHTNKKLKVYKKYMDFDNGVYAIRYLLTDFYEDEYHYDTYDYFSSAFHDRFSNLAVSSCVFSKEESEKLLEDYEYVGEITAPRFTKIYKDYEKNKDSMFGGRE